MATLSFAARRRAYLFLLNDLRFSRSISTFLVKFAALLVNPLAKMRRRVAGPARHAFAKSVAMNRREGYRLFGPSELPGTGELLTACGRIFAEAKEKGDLYRYVTGKDFLVPVVANPQVLMAVPAIRDFVLSEEVVGTAVSYLDEIPILSSVELLWSPVNDTNIKSQQYHFDAVDYRQLKLFVNILECDRETGPFTFVPASRSAEVSRAASYVGGRRSRMTDDAVESALAPDEIIAVTGSPGSGVFVDSSRCLHYGSRGNRKERLVLLVQFLSYYAPEVEPTNWRSLLDSIGSSLDSSRRLLFDF
jgi:hypothetical protein